MPTPKNEPPAQIAASLTPPQVRALETSHDIAFTAAQMSLDLFGRTTPLHCLLVKLNGEGEAFRWYRPGREPRCREVVGSHGNPLVSFAIPQDCGKCDECRPPEPLTTHRPFLLAAKGITDADAQK